MNGLEYGFDDASRGADIIREKVLQHGMEPYAIQDGVVLGSGLGSFAKEHLEGAKAGDLSGPVVISYDAIYAALGMPAGHGKVEGHNKEIIVAPLQGTGAERLVMALSGREHPYEGVDGRRATFLLRVMQLLGVKTLFGSNAAGIITPDTVQPPALVLTHSNKDLAISVDNPLIGPNDERFGPRFPHMMDLYPAETRAIVRQVAENIGVVLQEGTYIRFKGPNYESPEEISHAVEMLENMWTRGRARKGEDRFPGKPVGVVGMSSTYEALVAQHATQSLTHPAFLDGRAFVSVATNYAGSVGPDGFVEPSSHQEVQENAAIVQERFALLARGAILKMRQQ